MRWRDWYFWQLFLPARKKWAQGRVEQLCRRRDDAYARLMNELRRLELELHDQERRK